MSPTPSNNAASREDLIFYEVPLHLRDNCSNILIPLNKLDIHIYIYVFIQYNVDIY